MGREYSVWQTDKTKIIVGIALLVCAILAGYWMGGGLRGDGGRVDEIRDGFSRIEKHQRDTDARLDKISTGLDQSVKATQRIAGRIETAAESVGSAAERIAGSQKRFEASQQRIGEGESIIRGIRQRAEKNTGPAKN